MLIFDLKPYNGSTVDTVVMLIEQIVSKCLDDSDIASAEKKHIELSIDSEKK